MEKEMLEKMYGPDGLFLNNKFFQKNENTIPRR